MEYVDSDFSGLVISSIIFAFILTELIFYIYIHWVLLPSLQTGTEHRKNYFEDPDVTLSKVLCRLKNLKTYSHTQFFSTWFLKRELDDLHETDLDSWVVCMAFLSHLHEISEQQREVVSRLRNDAVQYFGLSPKPGNNPVAIRHADFSISPISHIHHPLIVYMVFYTLELYSTTFTLRRSGYNFYRTSNGISYWYRKGKDSGSNKSPILYLHGINSGYINGFFTAISDDRPVIYVNNDFVKMNSMTFSVPDPHTYVHGILEILAFHGISQVSLIGHSWGTFLSAWIVKLAPHIISHITLIDPVSIVVFLPETAYTMCYAPPRSCRSYALCYFLRNDLTIAYTLHKHFEWYNACLFLEEIPLHIGVVISVSTHDEFIHCEAAVELVDQLIDYRNNYKAKCIGERVGEVKKIVLENFYHADAIKKPESTKKILEAIKENEESLIFTEVWP